MSLLFTLITGLFFLLGIILNKIFKDKKNFSVLAIALAFVVLINLIGLDLLPEVAASVSWQVVLCVILGFILLKIMDLFVPHHEHHHKEKKDNVKEHNNHLEHISIITILALTLHNVIECMALYNVSLGDLKAGFLMCLAIGLHNIPLGFQIGGSLEKHRKLYIGVLTLSGLVGGFISLLIGTVPEIWTIYILAFTLGMLIYLTFFELLKELITSLKNIYALYGIIIGIVLVIITNLL
ncbi:MAG: ZIP family metal transporter [Bacilli bacterium]|nr:ZIP family metal transporter [Bacilli bacterium]